MHTEWNKASDIVVNVFNKLDNEYCFESSALPEVSVYFRLQVASLRDILQPAYLLSWFTLQTHTLMSNNNTKSVVKYTTLGMLVIYTHISNPISLKLTHAHKPL